MAISETKGQGWRVKQSQRYINLNPGCLFYSAATQKGKGIALLTKVRSPPTTSRLETEWDDVERDRMDNKRK